MSKSTHHFSKEEKTRYARQIILPMMGEEKQTQLKNASILLIGAGGLGSAPAIYLAAAGVGTIGLVDSDTVALTNLHRQILHTTEDLGRLKVDSGAEKLKNYNPHTNIRTYATRLSVENAIEIFKDYDLIIDGTDNLPARYLINDACFFLKKNFIFGGVHQFEGQLSLFGSPGPCYRCIFPHPPPQEAMPSCAEAGVIGIIPGIIGLMQANEAIKWICHLGQPLNGRLLIFDALLTNWREVKITKDKECPLCGPNPSIKTLQETSLSCLTPPSQNTTFPPEITVKELKQLRDQHPNIYILDVREAFEWEIVHIQGSTLMPLSAFEKNFAIIPKDKPIYCLCHFGGRSQRAIEFLKSQGYQHLINVHGGIDAWGREIDPTLPCY